MRKKKFGVNMLAYCWRDSVQVVDTFLMPHSRRNRVHLTDSFLILRGIFVGKLVLGICQRFLSSFVIRAVDLL